MARAGGERRPRVPRNVAVRRRAVVLGAFGCAAWCWWLLSMPWLLGADVWTVVLPWALFAFGWAGVTRPGTLDWRSRRTPLLCGVVPAILLVGTVVGDVLHLPLAARVALSEHSLLRAVPPASEPNAPEQRARLYTVTSAPCEPETGGTVLQVKGGILGTGALEYLRAGSPHEEPNDEWDATVHVFGPWCARSSPIP